MKSITQLALGLLFLSLMACTSLPDAKQTPTTNNKTTIIASNYGHQETIERLQDAIQSKGMTVFSLIDHQAAAKQQGLQMQPATVIIYGNPKAGTPLMVKDPAFALSLPLKVLVTKIDGQVSVVYTPSDVLIKGTNIEPSDIANTLANAEKLIQATIK